jgi:hypothetical protein
MTDASLAETRDSYDLANLLHEAGFELWTTAVRQPEGLEVTPQGYILARKPQP